MVDSTAVSDTTSSCNNWVSLCGKTALASIGGAWRCVGTPYVKELVSNPVSIERMTIE